MKFKVKCAPALTGYLKPKESEEKRDNSNDPPPRWDWYNRCCHTSINRWEKFLTVTTLFAIYVFDLKQCLNSKTWHQSTARAIKEQMDPYALESLSQYFDVTQWSFCAAPLQVEHIWCHRPSPMADRHHDVEPALWSSPHTPASRRIPILCSENKITCFLRVLKLALDLSQS